MSSTKSSALFFGFLLSGPTTVEAVVLAPSVVTLYSSGYDATEELPRGSRASSSVQVVATTFTLTERAMISSITAQAIYYGELNSPPPSDDQFHITFYSDAAGSFPASPLGSPLVTTNFIRFDTNSELSFGFQEDFRIFEFEILLDEPQSLAAGSYWISITNFTPESPEVRWSWIFTSEDPEDPRYASNIGNETASWLYSSNRSMVFKLNGTVVPEVSSCSLSGLALTFLLGKRRRGR